MPVDNPIQNIAGNLVGKKTSPKIIFTTMGILNLFLLDGYTPRSENLVLVSLLRKYGRTDAVFFITGV